MNKPLMGNVFLTGLPSEELTKGGKLILGEYFHE